MRIGFDASPLVRPHPPGVVRAVAGALAALERAPGLTALRLAPAPGENLRLWRQVRLATLVRERELLGVHSFLSAFPLAGTGRRVQTVHELPWLHGVGENAGLTHRFWARVASLRADRVVCASEFVARELDRGALAGRVRVCPWGVDAARFSRTPEEQARRALDELLGLAPDGRPGPIVVAPGAVRAKKNLRVLLEALAAARGSPEEQVRLVVTGPVGGEARSDQRLAGQLGVEAQVRWVGELDEAVLVALYHASAAAALLSRSEGFGLPVLEAFAAGRPVIVAEQGSAAEVGDVAGGLAVGVDPSSPAAVLAGLRRALSAEEHSAERAARRLARAQAFSWERCAGRIAEVWRELL